VVLADHVILVGEYHREPLLAGLREGGAPESAITTAGDSAAAQALLADLTRPGDVILFENDLPDLYTT